MGDLMITDSRALQTLRDIVVSGRPLIWVRTSEEGRLLGLLRVIAEQCFATPVPVWTWSLTEGLHRDGEPPEPTPRSPRATLDAIAASPEPGVFLLRDFHEPLRDAPDVRRRFRDLYEACRDRDIVVVVSAPGPLVADELARAVVSVELGLPDLPELRAFLDARAAALTAKGVAVDASAATLDQLARALQGLTVDEAGHALQRAVAEHGRLDASAVPSVLEEKRLLVNRTGMIEFVNAETRFDHLGGMGLMKQWLAERTKLFRMREELDREIVPKGVLVMGVSGCGKSLAIKAIASAFELPLYRIDMIEVFSGRHGTPEGAFAAACNMLTALAPAVVWFDEIEAAITANAKESDLGRIFGFFLTWMQEKPRGLFVGATANRIDLLPAEMIRKGRFDEVFFVDLPGDDERVEIFKVHLGRRNVDPSGFNLEPLKKITRGWTGAEIEQCVVSALTRARLADRAVTADDLFNATNGVVPLSKTMKEQVDHIRNWAFDRAVRASPRDTSRP
jgi:SpoVK/Ycf46/Vps4 family AAA+-type ATPase